MPNKEELNSKNWLNDPERMRSAEEWIFDAAMLDYDFWLNVSERVCLNPETGKDIDDFDSVERNIVFTGVRRLARLNCGEDTGALMAHRPDPEIFRAFLKHEAQQANLCSEDEVDGAVALYEATLAKSCSDGMVLMAKKFLPTWLSKKRARFLSAVAKHMTLDELMIVSERHSDAVSSISSSSDDIVMYGQHKRYQEESGEIHLVTLPTLSKSLGGFFKGDSYMFQSSSGGGKTVMAVQLLVDLVSTNNYGIFISTEQPWKEIEPRIIACACNIDVEHASLKNRFDYESLKNEKYHIVKVDDWEQSAAGKFVFFHWNSDNTQSVKTDLEATLRKGKAMLGRNPDFVILDWIGGAIGSEANSENLRFVYQATADAFAAAAQKHHFIGLALAQSKGDKVYYSLSSEHLAECKTMHRKYSGLVGVTAITIKDDKEIYGAAPKFQKEQFIDVSKSRKGVAARIPVERHFKFQKFQERIKVGGAAAPKP